MINEGPNFRNELFPFGGVKNSGVGKEGVKHAVNAMTHHKLVLI